MNESFIIVPFDTRASLKYAQLLHERFDVVKQLATDAGIVRQRMKADHMIIAAAIANDANCIYSYVTKA